MNEDILQKILADMKAGKPQKSIMSAYGLGDDPKILTRIGAFDYLVSTGMPKEQAAQAFPDVMSKLQSTASPVTTEQDRQRAKDMQQLKDISGMQAQRPSDISAPMVQQKRKAENKIAATDQAVKDSEAQKLFDQNFPKSDFAKKVSASEEVKRQQAEVNQALSTFNFAIDPKYRFYSQVINPFFSTVQRGTGDILATMLTGLTRTAAAVTGEEAIADAGRSRADKIKEFFRQNQTDAARALPGNWSLSEPLQQKGPVFNDNGMNLMSVAPRTVETLTNMAVLLAGAGAMGGGAPGLMASSYLNTYESSRDQALEAGLKGQQAENFADLNAGTQSLLEMVSPNNLVLGRVKAKIGKDILKKITGSMTKAEMIKEISKAYAKELGGEELQELLQMGAEKGLKHIYNETVLKDRTGFRDAEITANEVKETLLLTALSTGIMNTPAIAAATNPSRMRLSAFTSAAEDMKGFSETIERALQAGRLDQASAEAMVNDVTAFKQRYDQIKASGKSSDQAARMAWAAGAKQQVAGMQQEVAGTGNPGTDVQNAFSAVQQGLDSEIRDADMGIPHLGESVSGDRLVRLLTQIGDKGKPMTESRALEIGQFDYQTGTVDLNTLYEKNKKFKALADQYKKALEGGKPKKDGEKAEPVDPEILKRVKEFDQENLRMPAVVNGNEVMDGMHRLAIQHAKGMARTRAFNVEKNFAEPVEDPEIDESGNIAITENLTADEKAESDLRQRQEEGEEDLLNADEAMQPAQGLTSEVATTKPEPVAPPQPKAEKIKPEKPAYFQEYRTKNNQARVTYNEKGQRVVKARNGRVIKDDTPQARRVLAAHARNYNYNFGETTDNITDDQFPAFSSEDEGISFLIEKSNNPAEIATFYNAAPKQGNPLSEKDMVISRFGIKTTPESYYQHGDRNNMTKAKQMAYLNKKGLPLDVQAKEMSDDSGLEITPQDLVDFMDAYPSGVASALKEIDGPARELAKQRFEQLTGIPLTEDIAEIAAQQYLGTENQVKAEQVAAANLEAMTDEELENVVVGAWAAVTDEDIFGDTNDTENASTTEQDQQEQDLEAEVQFDDSGDEEAGITEDMGEAEESVPGEEQEVANEEISRQLEEELQRYIDEMDVDDAPLPLRKTKSSAPLLAPNGKPSNLTPGQYRQVRTPEFKAWFGDWENDPENASKVVDENGEPMVVYHGTNKDFDEFEVLGHGAFFAKNPEVANTYAKNHGTQTYVDGNIKPAFLNIRNLETIDAKGMSWDRIPVVYDVVEDWSRLEFKTGVLSTDMIAETINGLRWPKLLYNVKNPTGVYISNVRDSLGEAGPPSDIYIALRPNQIKSAIGNEGTFDPNDNRIFKKVAEKKTGTSDISHNDYKDLQATVKNLRQEFKGDPQMTRALDFLEPIIAVNPSIRVVEAKPDEYSDTNAVAFSYPDGSITLNYSAFGSMVDLNRALVHEMIHAATRHEIENNEAFRTELDDLLQQVRDALGVPNDAALFKYFEKQGLIPDGKYGTTNAHEMVAEVFSNREFYDHLKGIRYQGDNLAKRVIQWIMRVFSNVYKHLHRFKKGIEQSNLADYVMSLTESTVTPKSVVQGDKAGALPMAGREKFPMDIVRDFVRTKLKEGEKPANLRQAISSKLGITETEASKIIAEARKEKVPKTVEEIQEEFIPSSALEDNERPRGLLNRIAATIDPAVRNRISDDAKTYFVKANKTTREEARAFVDRYATDDLYSWLESDPKELENIPHETKVFVYSMAVEKLGKEIAASKQAMEFDQARKLADRSARLYGRVSEMLTGYGRAVQAARAFKGVAKALLPAHAANIIEEIEQEIGRDLTEAEKKEITDLTEELTVAPDGLPADKVAAKLAEKIGELRNEAVSPWEIFSAIWYAHILSGPGTHAKNTFANLANGLFEAMNLGIRKMYATKDPRVIGVMFSAWWNGLVEGLAQGRSILTTGVTKDVVQKFGQTPIFEWFRWQKYLGEKIGPVGETIGKGLDKPLGTFLLSPNSLKYVGRLLAAADAALSVANAEMAAGALAFQMASMEGKSNPDLKVFERASELMNNNKQMVADAKAKAEAEGFKPNTTEFRIRTYEFVREGRKESLNDYADRYGARVTFNYEPDGILRPVYDALKYVTKKVPYTQFFIPFLRIVTNITENSLNYTPIGLAKVMRGRQIDNYYQKAYEIQAEAAAELDPVKKVELEQRFKHMMKKAPGGTFFRAMPAEDQGEVFVKFIMGTLALAAVMGFDDDDDNFQITANGTGDVQKNYELMQSGWRPYSIKIGNTTFTYRDTPLFTILSVAGTISDWKKYGNGDPENSDFLDMLFLGAHSMMGAVFSQSWMQGIDDLVNSTKGVDKFGNPLSSGEKFFARGIEVAKSTVWSNWMTQNYRLYLEMMDSPIKRAAGVEKIYRDIPIFNDGLRPIIDIWGQDVVPETHLSLMPFKADLNTKSDPVNVFMSQNKIWVGKPKKKEVMDVERWTMRPMTDDEYYDYLKLSGQLSHAALTDKLPLLEKYSGKKLKNKVDDILRNSRETAYKQLFIK